MKVTPLSPIRLLAMLFSMAVLLSSATCNNNQPLPDLAINNVTLDASNHLTFTLKNEGLGPVTTDLCSIQVFTDGIKVRNMDLSTLTGSAAGYKEIGGSSVVNTGVTLSGTGRRVTIVVDPHNQIAEANEYQNSWSKTLNPATGLNGYDLAITGLRKNAGGSLQIDIANNGNVNLPEGDYHITITKNSGSTSTGAILVAHLGTVFAHSISYIIPRVDDTYTTGLITVNITPLATELDNTNNTWQQKLGDIDMAPYNTLLSDPHIANNLIWERPTGAVAYPDWTADEKRTLSTFITLLEQRPLPLHTSAPPVVTSYPGGYDKKLISPLDAQNIFMAHVAQSLWIEANHIVPWSMLTMGDANVRLLLDSRYLVLKTPTGNWYATGAQGFTTTWDPVFNYTFLKNMDMVKTTPYNTLIALTDWMRGNLVHINYDPTDPVNLMNNYGYNGWAPMDKMLFPAVDKRHITEGCWGTMGFYNAMLRTVNIPVKRDTVHLGTEPYLGGIIDQLHGCVKFPSLRVSLPHGDDVYDGRTYPSGGAFPSAVLFFTDDYMQQYYFNPTPDCSGPGHCNTAVQQTGFNYEKHCVSLAYQFSSNGLLYTYAFNGRNAVDDELKGSADQHYVNPLYNDAERAAMLSEIESRITALGNGNYEAGKQLVNDRYTRWNQHLY